MTKTSFTTLSSPTVFVVEFKVALELTQLLVNASSAFKVTSSDKAKSASSLLWSQDAWSTQPLHQPPFASSATTQLCLSTEFVSQKSPIVFFISQEQTCAPVVPTDTLKLQTGLLVLKEESVTVFSMIVLVCVFSVMKISQDCQSTETSASSSLITASPTNLIKISAKPVSMDITWLQTSRVAFQTFNFALPTLIKLTELLQFFVQDAPPITNCLLTRQHAGLLFQTAEPTSVSTRLAGNVMQVTTSQMIQRLAFLWLTTVSFISPQLVWPSNTNASSAKKTTFRLLTGSCVFQTAH